MDFNNLSDEELKSQFPGLYDQMSAFIAKMIQGKSPNELLAAMEKMQNATISGGNIYDSNGDLIGSFKSQLENDFDVGDINDDLLKEMFSGVGIIGNGEIKRNPGMKDQAKSTVEELFKK